MNFLQQIDTWIDRITMYRLVLYELVALLGVAVLLGTFGLLPLSPVSIIASVIFFLIVCWSTNTLFSSVFEAPTNIESSYITALILALIVSPIRSAHDLPVLGWTAILAIASKYIVAIKKKHIFNPAAFAVVITAFALNRSASWWIGNAYMLSFVLIGGLMIVRKIRKFSLVFTLVGSAVAALLFFSIIKGSAFLPTLLKMVIETPLFFLASIMLTEPLTIPPKKWLQMIYGILVGILFIPDIHVGSLYLTPEIALCVGNIFVYLVSPKQKLFLQLKEKIQLSPDTFDFLFTPEKKLAYVPGQYMEWTLAHAAPDSRGNRRYFTLASSPTEDTLRLGVKLSSPGSSYKQALLSLDAQTQDAQTQIVGAQLSGDFVLPKDPKKKCVFIAGGIGITPFRSMLKYLIDRGEHRDIILFYVNKTASEIVYGDVLAQAEQTLGIKTIHSLTDMQSIPTDWVGHRGRLDGQCIIQEVPDFMDRYFYISGPHTMVIGMKDLLRTMNIPSWHIKTDFFPGLV